jgi:hypothetical protein
MIEDCTASAVGELQNDGPGDNAGAAHRHNKSGTAGHERRVGR